MRSKGRNKPPFYITIYYLFICLKHDGCVANSVDPDQTQLSAACDLGPRCLPYMSKYGKYIKYVLEPNKLFRCTDWSWFLQGYPFNIFLISQRNHMFWVVSCGGASEYPQHMFSYTADSRYLEVYGILWNTLRYPFLDISNLQNWEKKKKNKKKKKKNKLNSHISQTNM